VRGKGIGSRRVRVGRARNQLLQVVVPGRWRATPDADRPRSASARALRSVRGWLFGEPLSTELAEHERLSKTKALAVFASDALSSTAYATEEILLVLIIAGTGALHLALPIAAAIAALLLVVVISYRQTVKAYPNGGGSYIVAKDNLGAPAGLVAAAALLTDYVLTVAVSISAGTLAIISAFPALAGHRLELALVALAIIALVNLRGVRESGAIFAIPTYVFIAAFAGLIALGLARLAIGLDGASLAQSRSAPALRAAGALSDLGILLVLRAFSSGCTALTGVEAIANGVMAFRTPESRNAAITMSWMGGILGVFFIGATFLAIRLAVVPVEDDSVISQVGRLVFGGETLPYFVLQAGTALVLVLAANTAFNDFPRLSSILANDRYMPRQFAFVGDRLTFSVGIIALTVISGLVLAAFRADTHRLIPLYAVGVFVAFTLSQSGMFVHWRRLRTKGWRRAAAVNGMGAIATGVVAVIVAGTKFSHGAWLVLVLLPLLVFGLLAINRHYAFVERVLQLPAGAYRLRPRPQELSSQPMIVPVREVNLVSARALDYACSISSTVTAVHIARGATDVTSTFDARWHETFAAIPLVQIESPFRTFIGPLRAYVEALELAQDRLFTIVVPEFKPERWWQRPLHNRTGQQIEEALDGWQNVVVTHVPISLRTVEPNGEPEPSTSRDAPDG
jgi:amino acid transporter